LPANSTPGRNDDAALFRAAPAVSVDQGRNVNVLLTGCAGFIGMHTAQRLLAAGASVTGVDNFNPYYDVTLKEARMARLVGHPRFAGMRLDLADPDAVQRLFAGGGFTHVVHLAAQPGVRYSLVNPEAYLRNNLTAFGHVLEGCRHARIAHLVYASSSSVYGANHTLPFSEDQNVDHPVSLYAATKKANELMAHSYSHLYGLPTTGLRLFTVYGPWGRPDMSPMVFTNAILAGCRSTCTTTARCAAISPTSTTSSKGIVRVLAKPPGDVTHLMPSTTSATTEHASWKTLSRRSRSCSAKKAVKRYAPMQPGDVPETYAAIDRLAALTGFSPQTPLATGLANFVAWYRDYYGEPADRGRGC
jgi:UDP-glucuronate 4-epimerase